MEHLGKKSEEIRDALRDLYLRNWSAIQELRADAGAPSCPFLVYPIEAYLSAPLRIVVVGQETRGWRAPGGYDPTRAEEAIELLMHKYWSRYEPQAQPKLADWTITSRRSSPFWDAFRKIAGAAGPDSEIPPVLWLNLVRFDDGGGRPKWQLAKRLASLRLVSAELRLLSPQLLIFFTGVKYDRLFPIEFGEREWRADAELGRKYLSRVDIGNEIVAYRTYHPNYLRLSKKFGVVLGRIEEEIDRLKQG